MTHAELITLVETDSRVIEITADEVLKVKGATKECRLWVMLNTDPPDGIVARMVKADYYWLDGDTCYFKDANPLA